MKNYFKKLWCAIWASTEVDEKAATTPTTKKNKGKKPSIKNKKTKTNNNTKK